jgi:arsenate reductase
MRQRRAALQNESGHSTIRLQPNLHFDDKAGISASPRLGGENDCHIEVSWIGRDMTTVIFACVHNAGRSQMAAALFNRLAAPDRAQAISAGTQPAVHVHPEVVTAMRELGIDLSEAQPRLLTGELAGAARLLVTMGCGEHCPVLPGLRREDWNLPDPKGQPIERVRAIRDEIHDRIAYLVQAEGWQRSPE